MRSYIFFHFFIYNDTPTTETYTLSLHDALPICILTYKNAEDIRATAAEIPIDRLLVERSEEHTSELQSPMYLVCRLLLEKKKNESRLYIRLNPSCRSFKFPMTCITRGHVSKSHF